MRREGRLRGKPTNRSNASGRCSRKACTLCHARPPSKALSKTKGRRSKLRSSPSMIRTWKPHLHRDPSPFDLHDYDAQYDDELDVLSDEDVCANSDVIEHWHETGCDNHFAPMDGLLHGGDRQAGCLSVPHDEVSDAIPSLASEDFVVVSVQDPDVCHHNASPSGLPHTSQSFPPRHEDERVEWCQVAEPDVGSDEDDWLLC